MQKKKKKSILAKNKPQNKNPDPKHSLRRKDILKEKTYF